MRTITENDIKQDCQKTPDKQELSIDKILDGFDPESDQWDERLLFECAGVKLGNPEDWDVDTSQEDCESR